MTADELRKGQELSFKDAATLSEIVKLEILREQDFGSLELTSWSSKRSFDARDNRIPSASDPDFRGKETTESMRTRADQFLDDFVVPMWALADDSQPPCVAVVSHGLFLAVLWKAVINRFDARNIQLGADVGSVSAARPLEYIPAWTNTGYLEVQVHPMPSTSTAASVLLEHSVVNTSISTSSLLLKVVTINGSDHLRHLKRTRGGLGSAAYDTRQKQIDGFLKRPKTEDGAITD
jgi:broad specificity phosphatase PhoE